MAIFLGDYLWVSVERLNVQAWNNAKMQGTRRRQCLDTKEVVHVRHLMQRKGSRHLMVPGVIGNYH